MLCFVLIAVAVAEIVTAQKPAAYLRARVPLFAVMALSGLALIAVPMLLTMQFTALSNRPDVLLESALQGSLHPANLATLFSANVFGSHEVNYWGPGWRMPEIQFTDQSFNYLFVGAVPVLLIAWFGIAGGGLFRRGRLLLTGIMVVALLYMLGRYTPAFALVYELRAGGQPVPPPGRCRASCSSPSSRFCADICFRISSARDFRVSQSGAR